MLINILFYYKKNKLTPSKAKKNSFKLFSFDEISKHNPQITLKSQKTHYPK